jgi:hypothetical protein
MAATSSAFFSPETYRITDPIENLQLSVTLRKRGGTILASERSEKSDGGPTTPGSSRKGSPRTTKRGGRNRRGGTSDDDDDDDDNASDDAAETGDAASSQPLNLDNVEEEKLVCPPRIFRWQEKVFGPLEVRAIRRDDDEREGRRRTTRAMTMKGIINRAQNTAALLGAGGLTELSEYSKLSNHHRDVYARLQEESAARGEAYSGEILYSRVHSEEYIDPHDISLAITDSASEGLTPLARAVIGSEFARQHRDMMGEAASVTMHIFAALPAAEVHESVGDGGGGGGGARGGGGGGGSSSFSRRSSALFGGRDDDDDEGEEKLEEVLLCALRLFPGGRLDVKPPFSVDPANVEAVPDPNADKMARWYSVPGTRFEYMIENLSENLGGKETQYEAIAERVAKLSTSAHTAVARAMPELDFARPPLKAARVHHFIELDSCHGFGPNPLYVVYYALASPGWRLLPHCVASAVTQTSKVVGPQHRAVLGYPLDLALESDGAPTSARAPLSLFLSIISRDAHERLTLLGYAHVAPPAVAGYAEEDVRAWRPAEGRTDALRRFFVGGMEELRDLRALAIPEGLDVSKPQCLNKHGLQTITSGVVRMKIHTVLQQQQPPAAPKGAQKLGAGGLKGGAGAGGVADRLRRSAPEMGSLKGVLGVSALARSETAADRVRKRLEERQRAAAQRMSED